MFETITAKGWEVILCHPFYLAAILNILHEKQRFSLFGTSIKNKCCL
jgi:hypothetical protein